MKKHVLREARVYLSGAMDYASDHGIGWRQEFINKSKHLGLAIMDPTNKPIPCTSEIGAEKVTIQTYKDRGEWLKLRNFVKRFRREDLRFTDLADFLVIKIDPKVHTAGTYDEIFTAERQKKPLLCIIDGGLKNLPTWCFAVFRIEEVFESVDLCIDYLNSIDSGQAEIDDRWILIGKYLKTGYKEVENEVQGQVRRKKSKSKKRSHANSLRQRRSRVA